MRTYKTFKENVGLLDENLEWMATREVGRLTEIMCDGSESNAEVNICIKLYDGIVTADFSLWQQEPEEKRLSGRIKKIIRNIKLLTSKITRKK